MALRTSDLFYFFKWQEQHKNAEKFKVFAQKSVTLVCQKTGVHSMIHFTHIFLLFPQAKPQHPIPLTPLSH